MSWLVNQTAKPLLTIDGTDYSDNLVSITLADQSCVNNALIICSGTITLRSRGGEGGELEDYDKRRFQRGDLVLIDLEIRGVVQRHPRGRLHVIDSTWDPENRQSEINVGCQLLLNQLSDNIDGLRSKTEYELPQTAGFAELNSAIQSEGYFIWQDRAGQIRKQDYYEGDGMGSAKEPAAFVSVRDYTCLASTPLGQGLVVPDIINITYQWATSQDDDTPIDGIGNRYDEDSTESTYWLEHPANIKKRQTVCTTGADGVRTCKEVIVNDAKRQFSVVKTNANRRYYGGPGGSVSSEVSNTIGPAVELNGSYYAETYSWEAARLPPEQWGNVQLKGLGNIRQGHTETSYEYGTGGEVLKRVQKTWRNMIAAMTPGDWRASVGEESGFDPENPPEAVNRGFLTVPPVDKQFLEQQVTTTWEYFDDKTIELAVTLKSSAQCNGVGIYPPTGPRILQDIDATNNGIETRVKRTSMGGLTAPDQPDRNPGNPNVQTQSAVYEDIGDKYVVGPAGPVVYATTMPYTNLEDTEADARDRAARFARITRAFMEGDAQGIRVAEAMREELFNYRPGMAFSYYDAQYDRLVKLRMNATGWTITPTGCLMATDGLFIGTSNGTVAYPPSNTVKPEANTLYAEYLQAKADYDVAQANYDGASEICSDCSDLMDAILQEEARRFAPPDADETFTVNLIDKFVFTTGAPLPFDSLQVTVDEPPGAEFDERFEVIYGPEPPQVIHTVTVLGIPVQTFGVEVKPLTVLEVTAIETLKVDVSAVSPIPNRIFGVQVGSQGGTRKGRRRKKRAEP